MPDQHFSNRRWIAQHIACRYSSNLKPLRAKPGIAPNVAIRIFAHVVSDAVDLDHQLFAGTEKIDHKVANRVLLAKLHPHRSLPQLLPEQHFRK